MTARPTMFIGSSREGLDVARALQAELEHDVDTTIWSQGVFGLSTGSLESLVEALERFQFAALVLTPDDLVTKRGSTQNAPRDNVLFELGLFMGALGRRRTFLVSPRDDALDLPSDLAGVTRAEYYPRPDLQATVGPVATRIRAAIADGLPRLLMSRWVSADHHAFQSLFWSWARCRSVVEQRQLDDELDTRIEELGHQVEGIRIMLDFAQDARGRLH